MEPSPQGRIIDGQKGRAGKQNAGNQQAWQKWQDMQFELLSLSTDSKQIVATESEHHIQLQQPKLVVDAIIDAIKSIREVTWNYK